MLSCYGAATEEAVTGRGEICAISGLGEGQSRQGAGTALHVLVRRQSSEEREQERDGSNSKAVLVTQVCVDQVVPNFAERHLQPAPQLIFSAALYPGGWLAQISFIVSLIFELPCLTSCPLMC